MTRRPRKRVPSGMTILELMIVIAIIGLLVVVMRTGFRALTKADLAEDATELAAVLRRAGQLAIEHGEQHRVVFDLDKQIYAVEVCQGQASIMRNEALRPDEEATKRAVEKGTEKLRDLPQDALATGDPDEATKRAIAIAGHHIADKACAPVTAGVSGDSSGKEWVRSLRTPRNIKFKEIWVQHKDDSTTKGQAAVYFFPNGSSEKAVIELTDGDAVHSILVHGLTGRVQQKSSKLDDVDTHMLRNVMGDRDAKREDQ
ncbi:MAG TPA: type II secretion system protein [Kofleriaceae bacterium]|nr:type II secretion system protein [Kofleriaceae bacterium]